MAEVVRMERHKEDNIVFMEEATVMRILRAVLCISGVSATGGGLLVQGSDEDVASAWYTIRTAEIEMRPAEVPNGE